MMNDTKKILEELSEHLFVLPMGDYLRSEDFALFCRQHDLWDIWKEYRVLSRDRPELYGHFVVQQAFARFLHHILKSRPDTFLEVITHLLIQVSGTIGPLPLCELRSDLSKLGCPAPDLEGVFSLLENQERRGRFEMRHESGSRPE